MNDADRKPLLAALAHAREVLESSWPETPAPAFSQAWVDRRRLLVVDLALEFAQQICQGSELDTRVIAERMEAVLHVTHEVAPGYGLDRAAGCILEGLAGEGPEVMDH